MVTPRFVTNLSVNDQTSRVIKGAVVDKKENPLPDAKVLTIKLSMALRRPQ
jgi:hypothetical protein